MSSTSSADADSETEIRKRPPVHPLSQATSRRLLRGMLERAEQGDAASAEVLIRLAREARRPTQSRGALNGPRPPR
jgi:hypothetical protein